MDTTKLCPVCDDTGWKTIGEGRDRRVTRCDCRRQERTQKLLQQARIPKRYEHCELSNFEMMNGHSQPSLSSAVLAAQRFVAEYPVEKAGLLIIGPIGVGKTHLSVGIVRELVVAKGIPCLFYDYRELLKEIQNSYNASVAVTEMQVLRPIFDTEVLVLDELGAVKPTEWVWDTVSHILNTRYNDERTTLITTNFKDLPPSKTDLDDGERARAFRASREETLGDRIGERMRSRLHEMCKVVRMDGEDFRTTRRSATISEMSQHTPGFKVTVSRGAKPPESDKEP
ncbi:MAG: ATP-binding protein [Acidobacteriia bacterium]|nr:ATP-binding protein [Terriglobia bacterium]